MLESKKLALESKKLELENKRLELESEKRTKLFEKEDKRLAAIEFKLDVLLLNADSSSPTPPSTGSN